MTKEKQTEPLIELESNQTTTTNRRHQLRAYLFLAVFILFLATWWCSIYGVFDYTGLEKSQTKMIDSKCHFHLLCVDKEVSEDIIDQRTGEIKIVYFERLVDDGNCTLLNFGSNDVSKDSIAACQTLVEKESHYHMRTNQCIIVMISTPLLYLVTNTLIKLVIS